MDPFREIGKTLLVIGAVLVGLGVLLLSGAKITVPDRPASRRHRDSRSQRQLLFSHRDLHRRERIVYSLNVDSEFVPALIS